MLFDSGKIVLTRAVADLAANNGDFARFVNASLIRHLRGDWGDVPADDAALNDRDVSGGGRLLSSYPVPDDLKAAAGDDRVWIITESDRSVTTILYPCEY